MPACLSLALVSARASALSAARPQHARQYLPLAISAVCLKATVCFCLLPCLSNILYLLSAASRCCRASAISAARPHCYLLQDRTLSAFLSVTLSLSVIMCPYCLLLGLRGTGFFQAVTMHAACLYCCQPLLLPAARP